MANSTQRWKKSFFFPTRSHRVYTYPFATEVGSSGGPPNFFGFLASNPDLFLARTMKSVRHQSRGSGRGWGSCPTVGVESGQVLVASSRYAFCISVVWNRGSFVRRTGGCEEPAETLPQSAIPAGWPWYSLGEVLAKSQTIITRLKQDSIHTNTKSL